MDIQFKEDDLLLYKLYSHYSCTSIKYHDTGRYFNINKSIIYCCKSPFCVGFNYAGSSIVTMQYLGRKLSSYIEMLKNRTTIAQRGRKYLNAVK